MKKSIIILFVFFSMLIIPFITNAEECSNDSVKIQSISIKDKSEYVEELSDTTFKDNKLNLDLKMYDVGDYIEYELKVKNDSNEDYYLNKDSLDINSDYFEYSITFSDNSNKIEPNTEKTIYLRVEYKNEVEKDKFFSGKYVSNNTVTLKSINTKNSNSITNPLTNNNKLTIFLFILLIIQLLLYFTRDKRINKIMILLLGILLPFEVAALCNFELDINSNITIGKVKPNPCTYDGELVQGTEYVNGQFTYRYRQKIGSFQANNSYSWINNDNDGWAVILTDLNSTDDVNTKICSTINEKPVNIANNLFFNSKAKNINISDWDTSNLEDISYMFVFIQNVEELNLSNWDLTNVTNMSHFVNGTNSLKKVDFSNVNLEKVKDLSDAFSNNTSLEEFKIDNCDISKVEIMDRMFSNNPSLKKIDMSSFDTDSLISMDLIFNDDTSLETINLDGFDLSKLENDYSFLGAAFIGAENIKRISMKNWKIPKIFKDAVGCRNSGLCARDLEYIDVTGWDLSKTKNIFGLFGNLYSKEIRGLDTWDTSNIMNMGNIFYSNKNLSKLDLSSWNTSKVTDMSTMFSSCPQLKTIYVSDKFKTNNVSNSSNMFDSLPLIVGGNGTTYDSNHVDKEYAKVDEAGKPGYFTRK